MSQAPQIEEALRRFESDTCELLGWIQGWGGSRLTDAQILNDKGWSVVIQFGPVVLKMTASGVYPDGPRFFELVGQAAPALVPELMAWRVFPDGAQAMLFRAFGGTAVEILPLPDRPNAIVSMARSTARIQAAVLRMSPSGIKCVPAKEVPFMFDEILDTAVGRCRADFGQEWSVHCQTQQVDEDFADTAREWRGAVAEWGDELESGGFSKGIDHVDLLPHNAHLTPDGTCLVYDWEQATIGVPFFSLDVLLAYAQSIDEGHDELVLRPERSTPTQRRLRKVYLEDLPGPLELSLRLAPLRYCHLEWAQAVSARVPHYGVDDVVWWLSRALKRWVNLPTNAEH